MFLFRSAFLYSLLGFVATHSPLLGITSTWNVPGSGDWSVNGNWSPPVAPNDPGDVAIFINNNPGPATISIPPGFTLIQTLSIDSPQSYILVPVTIVGVSGSVVLEPATAVENAFFNITDSTGNGAHTITALVDLTNMAPPQVLEIVQQSTSPFTISGNITAPAGVAVTYNGPQTMILSGSNSFDTLNISGGTVQISTPTSLSGNVVNSANLQLPTGNINVSSFDQTSSGTLAIAYNSPTNFTQLLASGTADLGGNLIISIPTGATVSSTPVTIIQSNSLTGRFANVTTSGMFVPTLNYGPQTLTLSFTPMVSSAQKKTLQLGSPLLLGSANRTTCAVQRQQVNLISRIQVNKAPEPSPSRGKHSSMLTAYNELSAGPFGLRLMADDEIKKQKQQFLIYRTAEAEKTYAGRFYIGPTATLGEVRGRDYTQNGAQAGVDYAFTEFGIGGLFSYDHLSTKGLLVDQASGTLYASYVPKNLPQVAVSGNFGFTYDWLLFHTRKGLEDDLNTAKGTPKGTEYTGLLAFQYIFETQQFKCTHQGLRISPYVALEYNQIDIDGFKEHGAGDFDVKVKKTTAKQLCSNLALFFYYHKEWGNVTILPLASVGWQRVLTQSISNIHLKPADTHNPFTTFKVKKPGHNYAVASADVQVYFYKRYGIEASWNFEWNKLYHDNEFYLGFSLMF